MKRLVFAVTLILAANAAKALVPPPPSDLRMFLARLSADTVASDVMAAADRGSAHQLRAT
ncbi:MAG TPA: hypothetical protein VF057_11825 [Thermoanaerobaculia bacterium]